MGPSLLLPNAIIRRSTHVLLELCELRCYFLINLQPQAQEVSKNYRINQSGYLSNSANSQQPIKVAANAADNLSKVTARATLPSSELFLLSVALAPTHTLTLGLSLNPTSNSIHSCYMLHQTMRLLIYAI